MPDEILEQSLEGTFIVGDNPNKGLLTAFPQLTAKEDPFRPWGWGDLDDLPWPVEEELLNTLGGDTSLALMIWKRLCDDQAVSSTNSKVVQNVVSRELVVDPHKEPGEEEITPENQEIADYVKDQVSGSTFDDLTATLMEAYIVGICNVQLKWKSVGDHKEWDGFEYIFPRRVVFSKRREPRILTKAHPVKGESLSKFRRLFITFRYYHVPTDSPYGRGLGVELYHPVLFLRRAYETWNVAGDRHATPLMIANVTADATPGEKALILRQIMNMGREKGLVLPTGWTVQPVQGRVDSQFYAQQVNLYQMVINKLIAGETTTGEDTSSAGSYARDKVSMDLLTQRSKMLSDRISETLNQTLIRWIVDTKYGPQAPAPRVFRSFPEQSASIDVQSLGTLIASGFEMDPTWISETYGVKLKAGDPAEGGGDPMAGGGAPPSGDMDDGDLESFFGGMEEEGVEDEMVEEGEGAIEEEPSLPPDPFAKDEGTVYMDDLFTEVAPPEEGTVDDSATEEEAAATPIEEILTEGGANLEEVPPEEGEAPIEVEQMFEFSEQNVPLSSLFN